MAKIIKPNINTTPLALSDFLKVGISVDCVILGFEADELKVLLITSDLPEFEEKWTLLGDLVRPDEDLEEASYRILKERTGLDDVYLEQVHTFGSVNRHPSGRVITIAYFSLVNLKDIHLTLNDNNLHWHPVKDIEEMAFDHKLILDTCLDRLKERIWEEPIIFNLLPAKFSLRELQALYEAVLEQPLDRRNFRKKLFMLDLLEDTGEMEKDVPHRPGKLYRLSRKKQKTQVVSMSYSA